MPKKDLFICTSCGYESGKWLGKCPSCEEWNSFEEVATLPVTKNSKKISISGTGHQPVLISQISIENVKRYNTSLSEFDRVLGGGVVPGSLILLGGEPGVGKSTLMLQTAEKLSKYGKVFYVSGEESSSQIKMRSSRINVKGEGILFFNETELEKIEQEISNEKPYFLVIDSIQTLYMSSIDKAPGSVIQIREATARLLEISKSLGVSTFIIGHVTKDGNIAGPKILEHIVDTVLYFEGKIPYLILRAVKNRFGSTDEIGIFSIEESGIAEVKDPSNLFIDEIESEGMSISCVIEGTRPLLLEVQALVSNSTFSMPRRVIDGVETNKINKIIAVLEKQIGVILSTKDVFINLVGGIKITEPAIDMAICTALLSSLHGKPVTKKNAFIGEIGLSGEIRRISRIKERINEASRLGIEKIYIPQVCVDEFKTKPDNVFLVANIQELIKYLF